MTIRFLQAWNGYFEGQIAASPRGSMTEAQLVAAGKASYDLDGEASNLSIAKLLTDSTSGAVSVVDGGGNSFYPAAQPMQPLTMLPTSDLYISDVSNIGLALPNPYAGVGKANAPVHTSALVFDTPWNGFRYWLAYTPYPGLNSVYENPCLAASNDQKNWIARGRQPLVDKPVEASGYNADTHIFMSADNLTMYLAFRERITAGGTQGNRLKIMQSTDGVTWTVPVTIMTGAVGVQDFASPSIWWNGTGWTCMAHNLDASVPMPLQRYTSTTADIYGAWSAAAAVTLAPFAGRQWWHSFMSRMSSGQIVGLIQDNLASGQPGFVYWIESADDGVTFTLTNQANAGVGVRGYRSSFTAEPSPSGPIVSLYYGDLNGPAVYRHSVVTGLQRLKSEYQARHATYLRQLTALSPECQWADSFDRTDNASAIGTASSGGTYTITGTWGIRSNQAYSVSSGRAFAAGVTNNHEVQARISGVTSTIQQWIAARAVDTSNHWRLGTYSNASGLSILVLQTVVAGSIVLNKEVGVMAVGDIVALRCSGVSIQVVVNGIVQHTEISSVHQAGTGFGLQCNSGGATSNYDSLVCIKV